MTIRQYGIQPYQILPHPCEFLISGFVLFFMMGKSTEANKERR
jgi:hypothetical protein